MKITQSICIGSVVCMCSFVMQTSVSYAQEEIQEKTITSIKQGLKAFTEKRFQDALVHYSESLSHQVTGVALLSRAKTYQKLRRYEEALDDAKKAPTATIAPLGEKGKAENEKLLGELQTAIRAEALRKEGVKSFTEGKAKVSIAKFEESNKIYSQAITHYNIGRAYCDLGKEDKAIQSARKAQAEENGAILKSEQAGLDELLQGCNLPTEVRRVTWMTWAGGGVALVGAGLLTGSGIISEQAATDLEKIKGGQYESETEYNNLKLSVENKRTTGVVLLATGAGLTVIGLGVVIYDLLTTEMIEAPTPDGKNSPSASWKPKVQLELGPQRTGATLMWTF